MSTHQPAEDRIWHVDKDDIPVGDGWQIRNGEKNWQNFRVVNAFVRNTHGDIWIPRRGPHKRIFPDCLDTSMGGHVDWPETYEQAFARELMEELNLDAERVSSTFLGHFTPRDYPTLSASMKVWEIEMNEAPNYNPDDFTEFFWFSPAELHRRLIADDKAKGDLKALVEILYAPHL
ncbi:MAG: hypothetical protein RL141_848 [Candidatus Parcubacteria bacterium]|jgi:isopentenyl-diphosphate delta-isomerase